MNPNVSWIFDWQRIARSEMLYLTTFLWSFPLYSLH
jgi:hypothetical protein